MNGPPRPYVPIILPAAERDLAALALDVRRRADEKIAALAGNPRPPGVEKLVGAEDLYRVRIGAHRIVYAINDATRSYTIMRVRHRSDVYR